MSKSAKPQQPKLKASEKANLTVNLNNVSKSLKAYYASKDIDITKLKGGQIAFAALIEAFTRLIVNQCMKTVGKSKSNLLELKRENMNCSLLLNSDFKTYFVGSLEEYKENGVYSNVIPMTPKEMDEILGEFKNVSLSPDAKNYMHFLLSKVYVDVASACAILCTYAKKKSLDGLCVLSALKLLFQKQLFEPLSASVNLAMKLSGRDLEAKEGDDDGEDETHEGGDFEDGNEENADETEDKTEEKKKTTGKAAQPAKGPTKGNTVTPPKNTKGKPATETKVVADTKSTPKNTKGKQQIHVSEDEDDQAGEDEPEAPEVTKPVKKDSKKVSVGNKSNKKS